MKTYLPFLICVILFLTGCRVKDSSKPTKEDFNEIDKWDPSLVGEMSNGILLGVDKEYVKDTSILKSKICADLLSLIKKYSNYQLRANYSVDTRIGFVLDTCTFASCNYKIDGSCYARYKYWSTINSRRSYTLKNAPFIFKKFILLDSNCRKNDLYKGMLRFYIHAEPLVVGNWESIKFDCFTNIYLTKMNQKREFVPIVLPADNLLIQLNEYFQKQLIDYVKFIYSSDNTILKYEKR
jgi:hypothetical protein